MDTQKDNSIDTQERLKQLLREIEYCMMTTIDQDGSLRSRPMLTLQENDGDLWFFTAIDMAKVEEIRGDNRVNLSYVSKGQDKFASVSGRAMVLHDADKMKKLWEPSFKAWFPEGLDDPHLCLIKVSPDYAEYWDTPSAPIARLVGLFQSMASGKPASVGENAKIDLKESG